MLTSSIVLTECVCLEKTTTGWAGRRHSGLLKEDGSVCTAICNGQMAI